MVDTQKELLLLIIKDEGNCIDIDCLYCPLFRWCGASDNDTSFRERYEEAVRLYIQLYNREDLVGELL